MALAFIHPTAGQVVIGPSASTSRFRAQGGGGGNPPASANWYDDVFGMYTGATVVGNRELSPTAETAWAAATSGVNDDGTTVTITGGQTADGIQFNNRRWIWSGNSGVATDLSGTHQGGNTNSGNWQVNGDDFTMEYFTIDNETSPVNGNPPFYFNATTANGTHTLRYGHIKSAPTDCIKGPNNGTMQLEWMFFDGYYLGASGVHMDLVDMKAASATSYIKDSLFLGDLHPSSPFDASEPSTGMNAAIRCVSGDAHGYDGSGRTYERLIIVGSDDVNATATLLSFTSGTATGVSFYDILVDLREHNSLCAGAVRVEDWKVNAIDWDQCVADGFITVGADIPFPNLGTQPAAVPSTMSAPVITAVPGGIQWSDNTRPWNQRSLITQYDMRYSTDGSSWTTVTDVSLTSDVLALAAASNYRIQFRAVNGIGAGAWSASSNLVTVASATISVAEPAVSGHPYDVGATIGRSAALWPVDVTTTGIADGTEVYAKRSGTADTPALVGTVASNAVSGTLSAPLSATDYQIEVSCGALTDTTTGTFGTGHGMVMHSQSEPHRVFDSFYNDTPNNPAEVDWDNLVFLSVNHLSGSPTVARIDRNSGTDFTTSMKYLSNVLAQVAPGEKFVIRDAMEPGTGMRELMSDPDTGRQWDPHYQAILDYDRVTLKDQPTWLGFCWWAQDRAVYRTETLGAFAGPFFGQNENGTTFTLGTTYTAPLYSKVIDHCFTDADAASNARGRGAYSADEAKWTFFMNGFTHTSDLTEFERDGGGVVAGMRNIRETMEGLRDFVADSRAVAISTTEPLGYGVQVCRNNGSHPSETQRYGLPLMGEIIALNWLKAIGKVTAPVPRITGVTWATTHADVTVNVGTGNRLTTYRDELALGAVTSATHRMAVAGFAFTRGSSWNWPTSVAITDDGESDGTAVIRVSASFQNGDVLIYAGGGGTGQILTSDETVDYNLNIPVVKIAGVTNPMPPVEMAAEGAYLTASGI